MVRSFLSTELTKSVFGTENSSIQLVMTSTLERQFIPLDLRSILVQEILPGMADYNPTVIIMMNAIQASVMRANARMRLRHHGAGGVSAKDVKELAKGGVHVVAAERSHEENGPPSKKYKAKHLKNSATRMCSYANEWIHTYRCIY